MADGFADAVKWDLIEWCVGDGLDIGCGDSRPHDWFHGIDIKPGTGPRGPNQIMDARNLSKFADASHDFIFSSHLLQELAADEKNDMQAIVAGWWRLLKPNGYLVLFLPTTEKCTPRGVIDWMLPLKPWQMVDARVNGEQFFHVYRKCDKPTTLDQPKPEKVVAVCKLGAHGDALFASSVFPALKEHGYYTVLYCQETTEEVLRHDPHIDKIVRFESRVPLGELGELFRWLEAKYKEARILVECVEGTLLPSPQKIQYHFPHELRGKLMNFNYLDLHHYVAKVPLDPKRQKFYPSDEEKAFANEFRRGLTPTVVVLVPNGSSLTKMWPYAADLAKRLLEREDVTVVHIGDERGCRYEEHSRLKVIGTRWTVRQAMTFAALANVVVGEETGLLNSVALEPEVKKVVLLTHSTVENLTRDWVNTASLSGRVSCYPCHRLHYDWGSCNQDQETKAAACQSAISVDRVLREVEAGMPLFEYPKARVIPIQPAAIEQAA